MAWRGSLSAFGAVFLLISFLYNSLTAQPAQSVTTFEVAGIRINAGGSNRSGTQALPGGRLHIENQTVRTLIRSAYDVQDFQLSGGPGWIDSEGYDIEAKAAGNPPLRQIVGPMLQALLEDRFQLKIHRETKELPVYALVAAKGGLELKPTKCSVRRDPATPPPGKAGPNECGEIHFGPFTVDGTGIRMEEFTRLLAHFLERNVIDQTGFKGAFDVHLEFAPDRTSFGGPPGAGAASGNRKRGAGGADGLPEPAQVRPSLSDALRGQLGLRLESTKGPVEIIVIDHVERPSAN